MDRSAKRTVATKGKKDNKPTGSTRGRKRKLNHEVVDSNESTEVTKDLASQEKQEGKDSRGAKSQPKEVLCFKNPRYRENGYVIQTRIWKNLKQIMNTQKSQAVPDASIDAPASTKPKKKYSDLSGLPVLYTDPHTKLRYANSDEYRQIQHLSSDTITGLLALRKANQ